MQSARFPTANSVVQSITHYPLTKLCNTSLAVKQAEHFKDPVAKSGMHVLHPGNNYPHNYSCVIPVLTHSPSKFG